MTAAPDAARPCPLCGGELSTSVATIPFVLGATVAVLKGVPAEVCDTCGEAFLDSAATDDVSALLRSARGAGAEVLVMAYRPQDKAA
jgi:YgiT-type zinc finger domain-containing protein